MEIQSSPIENINPSYTLDIFNILFSSFIILNTIFDTPLCLQKRNGPFKHPLTSFSVYFLVPPHCPSQCPLIAWFFFKTSFFLSTLTPFMVWENKNKIYSALVPHPTNFLSPLTSFDAIFGTLNNLTPMSPKLLLFLNHIQNGTPNVFNVPS